MDTLYNNIYFCVDVHLSTCKYLLLEFTLSEPTPVNSVLVIN
jgi:hypothetical protein